MQRKFQHEYFSFLWLNELGSGVGYVESLSSSFEKKLGLNLTQSCNKIFLIHQVQVNFKCYNTCSNNVTKETARVNLIIGELQTLV